MADAPPHVFNFSQAQRRPSRWPWWLRRIALFFVSIATASLAGLFLLQRQLIYVPTKAASLPAADVFARTHGVLHDDVTLKTYDGLTLRGWRLTATVAPRDLWLLYFPGNGGHRAYREHIEDLVLDGINVVYFDYRGYGDNPGSPSESAIARDAMSAWNYVRSDLNVPPERIVLYGESLGGGVATRLAWDLRQKQVSPAGLILQSTFTSLVDAAKTHLPMVPVNWLLLDRYPSISRIAVIDCPILAIHGQRDRVVPFSLGERLFAAAPARSANGIEKRFLKLPAADHNDVWDRPRDVLPAIAEFANAIQSARMVPPAPIPLKPAG